MVVEPAGFHKLPRPEIEGVDAGPAGHRLGIACCKKGLGGEAALEQIDVGQVACPQRGAGFQVAAPVAAPADLGYELLGCVEAVRGKRSAGDFLFGQQPAADRGRESRDGGAKARPLVEVAARGVGAAGIRQEGREPRERIGAGGGEGDARLGQTVKLSPQPQDPLALGFWNTKPAVKSSSFQSITDPIR